jgi:hypothetical protein
MIYRIHFEPKGGHWVIQFQRLFMFWDTVQVKEEKEPVLKDLTFDTYEKAESFVVERGIDKAYDRRDSKGYATALQAGQVLQANVPHGYKLVPERG